MAKIEMVLRNDDGEIIGRREMDLDIGSCALHEAEGAIEEIREKALPELESNVVRYQHNELIKEQKKD